MSSTVSAVPTNIITGFLGAGKTTAILQLLQKKPVGERWAVLVNEFGEVGIDGSFFSGLHQESDGVFVAEVPGGCMCCTSGLSLQIALSQLLHRAKPDRLIIEPTGLGHPIEVLQTLSSEQYKDSLSVEKVITLVDARKLSDKQYSQHPSFRQQVAIADVVIGNKEDLYGESDNQRLVEYVTETSKLKPEIIFTKQGMLDSALLSGPTANDMTPQHQGHQHTASNADVAAPALPDEGFLRADNSGEGFKSVGWRFSPEYQFERARLVRFLTRLKVERMKAVFITGDGIFAYNLTPDTLTEQELDECDESRIEIIAKQIDDHWQSTLIDCQMT